MCSKSHEINLGCGRPAFHCASWHWHQPCVKKSGWWVREDPSCRVMQGLCWRDGFALNWWQHVTLTLPWKNAWWKPLGFTDYFSSSETKVQYSSRIYRRYRIQQKTRWSSFFLLKWPWSFRWIPYRFYRLYHGLPSPHGLMSKFMASVQTHRSPSNMGFLCFFPFI